MKLRFLVVGLLILSPTLLLSQVGVTGGPPAIANSPAMPGQERVPSSAQLVSLEGKVATEDGSSVPDAVAILECGNSETARASVDHSGNFSMSINLVDSNTGTMPEKLPTGTIDTQHWNQCELYSDAPGYESERLRMFGLHQIGVIKLGIIFLHPVSRPVDDRSTVSVTSLAAPDKAKKNFEKGQEQERKGKWSAACDYFKKAVEVYPRFAIAWLELGRSQVKQNDLTDAQQSFHRATEQDPHLVEGYVQSASLAIQQKQWKELADSTDHIVQLSPDSTPNFWFLNSAANFNLGDVGRAESSATRGLRLDPNHRLPQLEYLYGLILARRGDYKAAAEHMQSYLQLSPHAPDAAEAQNKLAQLQKLAASESLASR